MSRALKIGSRPSALAIAQAKLIQGAIASAMPGLQIEIVPIRSTGDKLKTASLANVGGKGLFVKELEEALAAGAIDIAVHSMKDVPAKLASPFRIMAVPKREDPCDVLISRCGESLQNLSRGAKVGTSSVRRRFQALRVRPDLLLEPLRGNVDTRLTRLGRGEFDAVIIAMAGLKRLGKSTIEGLHRLDETRFTPAGGQGALAVEAMAAGAPCGSLEIETAVTSLSDAAAVAETSAERAFLAAIDASCATPVGVKATAKDDQLLIRCQLFSTDGKQVLEGEIRSACTIQQHASEIGSELAQQMLARGAAEFVGNE